jgi:hypothetical protein
VWRWGQAPEQGQQEPPAPEEAQQKSLAPEQGHSGAPYLKTDLAIEFLRPLVAQKRRSIELADWSACWGEADDLI